MIVPPIGEQECIVAFVIRESASLNSLVENAARAVDLLQERRSALISAAVTGKIDVRQVVPECVA
jgi:type I restriction enzyme, S subunit